VVGIQSEIGAIKIGLEMYDGPYNNKAFPLEEKHVFSTALCD